MSRPTAFVKPLAAAVAVAAMLLVPCRSAAQSPVGVWRMTHYDNAQGEGTAMRPAYTAYFGNGYYVIMWEATDAPRADLPENPTDAQLVAAWQPLVAQFGTYEVDGSAVTYTQLVSKNPASMRPENRTYTRNFRIEGNTLTTFTDAATYTYRRVD